MIKLYAQISKNNHPLTIKVNLNSICEVQFSSCLLHLIPVASARPHTHADILSIQCNPPTPLPWELFDSVMTSFLGGFFFSPLRVRFSHTRSPANGKERSRVWRPWHSCLWTERLVACCDIGDTCYKVGTFCEHLFSYLSLTCWHFLPSWQSLRICLICVVNWQRY